MVKVVSLSDEIYGKLSAVKGDRSFSELINCLLERKNSRKKSLADFYGAWAEDSEYWENFKKKIRKSRNETKLREVKF